MLVSLSECHKASPGDNIVDQADLDAGVNVEDFPRIGIDGEKLDE